VRQHAHGAWCRASVESVHAVCSRRDYCTFALVVASRPIGGMRRMASNDPASAIEALGS
jgi:hypothetical protein